MADETRVITGSFKGVPIAIDSGSVTGGRKVAVKQFPSRDTQTVEDLGQLPRKYTLEIVISDKIDQDYFNYRNRLLAVLDAGGAGDLIHPLYGRISDVVAVSYSLNENFGSFGDSVVTVNFEIDDNTGIPQSSGNVATQIESLNDTVVSAVNADIAANFGVTNSFTGNFGAAVDKIESLIELAGQATDFTGEAAQTLNEFNAELVELSADVNSLVSSPSQLADSVTSLFNSVNGLYASADTTFDTFTGFFVYGDNDPVIQQNTAGRVERQNNNGVLNGAVAASALGYAYFAATLIEYTNTQQIDNVESALDGQFEAVQDGGASQDVKDAVTDMRIQVLNALDEIRINTPRIITVSTTPTTVRLLGFDYYGNDENGQVLADLNDISDVSFIEGDIKVLTA